MNRQERRAAAAKQRKWQEGDVIRTESFRDSSGQHYWFVTPGDGWTRAAGVPEGVEIHGPFGTQAEAYENQRLMLLGPQCEVIEGGMWDPAWDRMR
jgi:hypothetical protein